MMHMQRKFPVLLFLLFLVCTSGERIAGCKGGSETTNSITASIHHNDGTPARGSIVRLRRADYVSQPAALAKTTVNSADQLTDSQGRFMLTCIDPGEYCIEVNDTMTPTGGGAVLLNCTLGISDTVNFGNASLQPYGKMNGFVDGETAAGRRLYAQVQGLERLTPVNSDGTFIIDDLPAGDLNVRIVDGETVSTVREIRNVTVTSGDTTPVPAKSSAHFSKFLYLNDSFTEAALTETISGFPLLLRFDTSTFNFSEARPDGEDLRFRTSGGTTLPHEIEQWDQDEGRGAVWVRIDNITSGAADHSIIMTWGDSDADDRSDGTTVFDTANGFVAVWHMNENPASDDSPIKDRTANGYNGNPDGNMTIGNSVSGVIGTALRFDGSDDHITTDAVNVGATYTLSCWINASELDSARRIIWKEYSYTLWHDANAGGIRVEHFANQDTAFVWRGIYQDNSRLIPLSTDTWYYLAGTYDGDRIRLYINGELADSTKTIGLPPVQSDQILSLGGRSGEYFSGIMDEVRIENEARCAQWIRLCYLTQRPIDGKLNSGK